MPYNHHERKSDEPSDAAATTEAHEVEASDRGLFGFVGKKEEEKKCDGEGEGEGEVIASEFDEKVKVSDEKEHGGLLQKLHRSASSSSSVSSLCLISRARHVY